MHACLPIIPSRSVMSSYEVHGKSEVSFSGSCGEKTTTEAGSPVKGRSLNQREALPGEPVCVVCGRYGEYICDETDDDICSLECKQTLLHKISSCQKSASIAPIKVPASNECYYVRDDWTPEQSYLTYDQADILRRKLDIHVEGEPPPVPMISFSSCNLPQRLQNNLEAAHYEIPTPVQMQVIPAVLAGRNLFVTSGTGSGKSASFLIPVICHCSDTRVKRSSDHNKPLAMVLAPTRELCVQVEEKAKLLGTGLPFKTALVVGGDALPRQVYRIGQGIELIVGTPGRLIDLLTKHEIELSEVSILVLDEVDCMLQRGFRNQVLQIFRALWQPQVLMFSATVSQEVKKMAKSIVNNLIFISIGRPNTPNESIKQVVIWVESKQKKQKLFEILTSRHHFKPPAIVFVGSRIGADLLCEAITMKTGLKALSLHGEKTMKERRGSLHSFLIGEVTVLVATGVLGRGVDMLKVRQVIIFDMPSSVKEYIHQIGRASRLGEQGTAITFVNEEDKKLFTELIENLKSSGSAIPRELASSQYATISCSQRKNHRKRKHIFF